MTDRAIGWLAGTEYVRGDIRSNQRVAVECALSDYGISIDHENQLFHNPQRPPLAQDLDRLVFCYWQQPVRPLGAPDITETFLQALRSAGLRGMADGELA